MTTVLDAPAAATPIGTVVPENVDRAAEHGTPTARATAFCHDRSSSVVAPAGPDSMGTSPQPRIRASASKRLGVPSSHNGWDFARPTIFIEPPRPPASA